MHSKKAASVGDLARSNLGLLTRTSHPDFSPGLLSLQIFSVVTGKHFSDMNTPTSDLPSDIIYMPYKCGKVCLFPVNHRDPERLSTPLQIQLA